MAACLSDLALVQESLSPAAEHFLNVVEHLVGVLRLQEQVSMLKIVLNTQLTKSNLSLVKGLSGHIDGSLIRQEVVNLPSDVIKWNLIVDCVVDNVSKVLSVLVKACIVWAVESKLVRDGVAVDLKEWLQVVPHGTSIEPFLLVGALTVVPVVGTLVVLPQGA